MNDRKFFRPEIALVGWRLGDEFHRLIHLHHDKYRYVVISMTLPEEIRPYVEWHRMPCPKRVSFRLRWVIFYINAGLRIRRLRADLVHTIGPTPIVPNHVDLHTTTYSHLEFRKATAADHFRGNTIGWRIGQRIAERLELWWFRHRVGLLVALSAASRVDLRRHYPGAHVTVIPRGFDLQRFKPDEDNRRRIRRENSVSENESVAIFVDQDHRQYKGLEVAIQGFATASRTAGGPAKLWVFGTGNDRCASLIEKLGIKERVRFLGYRSHLEKFYQAADIFVLPTAYETFCRSAHEAAACGLPIVGTAVSGIGELIGADEAGIVIQRTPEDIVRALVSLSRDRKLRERKGHFARQRASAFERSAVAAQIANLHESLLAAKRDFETVQSCSLR